MGNKDKRKLRRQREIAERGLYDGYIVEKRMRLYLYRSEYLASKTIQPPPWWEEDRDDG